MDRIKQIVQVIEFDKIIGRKFYRVWFFSNERGNNLLTKFQLRNKNIERCFAVGGGGDFAFNTLSLFDCKVMNLCDIRQMANVTIDFKIALIKNFNFGEFLNFFLIQNRLTK